jgi:hypothetical protein
LQYLQKALVPSGALPHQGRDAVWRFLAGDPPAVINDPDPLAEGAEPYADVGIFGEAIEVPPMNGR